MEEAEKTQLDKAINLLRIAKCPDSDCHDGTVARGYSPDLDPWEWDISQCQWCHERDQLLQESEK